MFPAVCTLRTVPAFTFIRMQTYSHSCTLAWLPLASDCPIPLPTCLFPCPFFFVQNTHRSLRLSAAGIWPSSLPFSGRFFQTLPAFCTHNPLSLPMSAIAGRFLHVSAHLAPLPASTHARFVRCLPCSHTHVWFVQYSPCSHVYSTLYLMLHFFMSCVVGFAATCQHR